MDTLKKVHPYHSVGAHRRNGVYHDRSDCPTGQLIHSEHLASGGRGLRHCDQCQALNEAERPEHEPS